MLAILHLLGTFVANVFRSGRRLEVENLFLRHQLNIALRRAPPEVMVRIGEWQIGATARVLDRKADRELWDKVAALADRKYGWGDGLPIEITPLPPSGPTDNA
jgi:hypothetical protein